MGTYRQLWHLNFWEKNAFAVYWVIKGAYINICLYSSCFASVISPNARISYMCVINSTVAHYYLQSVFQIYCCLLYIQVIWREFFVPMYSTGNSMHVYSPKVEVDSRLKNWRRYLLHWDVIVKCGMDIYLQSKENPVEGCLLTIPLCSKINPK